MMKGTRKPLTRSHTARIKRLLRISIVSFSCLALASCTVSVQGVPFWEMQPAPQARSGTDRDQEQIDRALGPRPKGIGVVILGAAGLLLLSAAITAGGIYALAE